MDGQPEDGLSGRGRHRDVFFAGIRGSGRREQRLARLVEVTQGKQEVQPGGVLLQPAVAHLHVAP